MKPIGAVDIVCVADWREAQALRAALEWWQIEVFLHLVGQAEDLVRILGEKEPLSKHIALMCHGTVEGLVLPELHPTVEDRQP